MKAVKADSKNQIAFLQAMLNQIRLDDPKVRLLIEQELNKKYKDREQREITAEIIRRLKIQNKKLLEQVILLRDQVKQAGTDKNQLAERLSDLRKLCKSLSEALGSCNICWGEDRNCINCSGNGSTGWRTINRRFFNIYILPALEKLYG